MEILPAVAFAEAGMGIGLAVTNAEASVPPSTVRGRPWPAGNRLAVIMDLHPFPTLAVILAIATVAGLIASRLRQPLIVGFIVVGIAVGPVGTGWVSADSTIELLAKFGISLLLFLVGLRLDLQMIRSTGPVALVTGIGQMAITSAIGYLIAIAFGMDSLTALYIACGADVFVHDHHREVVVGQA